MSSPPADVYTDFSTFARLRVGAREGAAPAREEAAQQMEAMFVSLMLKSMREAGASLGDDSGAGVQRDLYDSQIALSLARSGQLGFARTVLRDISPAPSAAGNEPRSFPAPLRNVAMPARDWVAIRSGQAAAPPEATLAAGSQAPGGAAVGAGDWDTPESFARALWPAAEKAAKALGTRPEAVLAVAALETGWGRHMPRDGDGTSSNNLFGIKAHGWNGKVTNSSTLEFEGGAFSRRVEPFRSYDTPEAAVADFAQFVRSNPRYHRALASGGDPVTFVRELHRAGYATDPGYGDKLEALVKSAPIRQAAAAAGSDFA